MREEIVKDVRQRLASKIGYMNRKYGSVVLPMVIYIGMSEYVELRSDLSVGMDMTTVPPTIYGYKFHVVDEKSHLRVALVDDLDE